MSAPQVTDVQVRELQQEGLTLLERAELMVVASREDADAAGRIIADGAALAKRIEAYHKPMKQQADAAKRAILDAEKRALAPIESVRAVLQPKVLAFREQEAARAREEARRLDEERRRAAEEARIQEAERLAAQGSTRSAEAILDAPVVVPPTPVIQERTEGVTEVKRWRFRVTDLSKLPLKFILANEKMLQSYASALKEQAELPGVEFYCETTLAARPSAPPSTPTPW